MRLETWARSSVAAAVVAGDTLVFAPAAIAAGSLLGPTHELVSRFYRDFARVALAGCGARVVRGGGEKLDPERRYVLVSNHASHLDALAILVALSEHPIRFVAKDDLGRIPLFGAALRATGNVMISRRDTRRDVERLEAARDALLREVSVLFFAEGTRTGDGSLGPFKKGAAAFAIRTGLPLVPIGVAGSYDIYPRGLEVRRGGTVHVEVGDPIEVKGLSFDDRAALTVRLREEVERLIARARER